MNQLEIDKLLAALKADAKEIQAFSKKKKKAISSHKKKHSISVKNPVQKEMAKWLLNFAHPLNHGIKEVKESGEVGHAYCNLNRQIEDHIQKIRFARRLNQKNIINHFNGIETRFYTNREKGPILVCLDLDNHGVGTLEEGERFFNHLRTYKIFRDLYWEVSTNGNGLHGYVIINPYETFDHGATMKNESLREFQKRLRIEAESFGIGDIEIKGTIPVCSWRNNKPVFRSGQLAKIPRDWKRFEELKKTASFDWSDLIQWRISPPALPSGSPSCQTGEKVFLRIAGVKESSVPPISRKWIKKIPLFGDKADKMIAAVDPSFMKARGRRKVVREDLMFALALIAHLSEVKTKANEDHMPHELIQETWKSSFEQGIVSRAWDNSRWEKIRSILTHFNLIDWIDETYYFYAKPDANGKKRQGKSCRWLMRKEVIQELEKIGEEKGGDSFVNNEFIWTPSESIWTVTKPVRVIKSDDWLLTPLKIPKDLPESVSKLLCV